MATVETWWTIHGAEILAMLRAVEHGETPDMVYAEYYANAEHSMPADEEDT